MKKIVALLVISLITISALTITNFATAATAPTVYFESDDITVSELDGEFDVNIMVSDVENLWSWHVDVTWDSSAIVMTDVPEPGTFFGDENSLFVGFSESIKDGYIMGGISDTIFSENTVSGSGLLATLHFKVIKQCIDAPVTIANITLMNVGEVEIAPSATSKTTLVSLIIPGSAPVADAGKDQTVDEHTTVTLNASKTIINGDDPTYTWTFTDGTTQTLTGKIVTYTFDNGGAYEVTLTVEDSLGQGTAMVTITVRDSTPPVSIITYQGSEVNETIAIDLGETITLDGSQSYDPGGGTISKYFWKLSGGLQKTTSTWQITLHEAKVYTVTLNVTDASGNSAISSVSINVGNADPNSTPNPTTGSTDTSGGGDGVDDDTRGGSSNYNQQNSSQGSTGLPPTIIGVLSVITVVVLVGSGFWLRKNNA